MSEYLIIDVYRTLKGTTLTTSRVLDNYAKSSENHLKVELAWSAKWQLDDRETAENTLCPALSASHIRRYYFFSFGRRQASPVALIWITLIFLYIHHQHLPRRERRTHFLLAIRFMDVFSLDRQRMSTTPQGQKKTT